MTQEDKQLLLQDLCARLPYGVKANSRDGKKIITITPIGIANFMSGAIDIIKPYLRPLSSMTEEEKKKYYDLCDIAEVGYYEFGELVSGFNNYDTVESIDYLNSIHVDYRGLIPRGHAIEVTKDNNPYK